MNGFHVSGILDMAAVLCDWIPEAGVKADPATHGEACLLFLAARVTGGFPFPFRTVLMETSQASIWLITVEVAISVRINICRLLELTAARKPHSSDTSSKVRSPLLLRRGSSILVEVSGSICPDSSPSAAPELSFPRQWCSRCPLVSRGNYCCRHESFQPSLSNGQKGCPAPTVFEMPVLVAHLTESKPFPLFSCAAC